MAAFTAAVALGYRYLETDVHTTADGVLVALHDDRLDRVTDRTGLIADLPWSEVQEAKVGGTEPIPRFDEVLDAFPGVRVNVDPKADRAAEPLAEAVRRAGAVDRVCVGAFSDTRLARLRGLLGARLCTSLGPVGILRLRLASAGLPTGALPAACAQVPTTARGVPIVDRRFVAAAHRRKLQVHVWTIDDPAEVHRLLDLGVDGLMTDRAAMLKAVLEERGQWANLGP